MNKNNKPYLDKFREIESSKSIFNQDFYTLMNQKNETIILSKSQFTEVISIDDKNLAGNEIDEKQIDDYFQNKNHGDQEFDIIFQFVQPNIETCIPEISEIILGQLVDLSKKNEKIEKLKIKIRSDFVLQQEDAIEINLNEFTFLALKKNS